ncbi:MAG: hypothetical protein Q8927_12105 [Bacteroidota bacterium]|nr:hypothetical protein [Bacteroidota bacterium]MDP4216935.1 hypothetical protein [Bacteroidota bacterium]MDP4245757.1 hypothetical protein [Bacteroidota bacterium]MDP4255495.1 hypothetical protein [Bacteroidota bacterium]MDP4257099.1 hypothetical protein [Bacteroidota bacterium]
MYTAITVLHSILRWVILILSLVAIFRSAAGMSGHRPFTAGDKKVGLFLMISAHTTLVAGLYLWFVGPWGWKTIENMGWGAMMKDNVARFYGIEHTMGMILAIVLITLGRRVSKTTLPDGAKHKRTFWFYLVALIIILASVPWPFRTGIARPWL